MKKRRNLIIGVAATVAIMAGIILIPRTASAEIIEGDNGIIYVKDSTNYDFATYWKDNKKAPVKEGYVFAGWYSAANEEGALTEETAANATEAYAKFVPDYVLSVRAQNEDGTDKNDGDETSTRVLSSVDSFKYQNVGFDIYLANKKQLTMSDGSAPLKTDKVFANVKKGNGTISATETFGAASKYFVVWRLDEIGDVNDSKIIYVRPYWVTPDGTTVYGLAKYVHVEDGYMNYINVPINLMTGEDIAAGIVKMTYKGLEYVGFEEGRLLTEMAVNAGTAGEINMAGNAENVDDKVSADGIYANLRFRKPATLPTEEDFTTTTSDFTDWTEEDVAITPIIQY